MNFVSVLSHHFFLQFSQIGSSTLHRYVCIYLQIEIFLYNIIENWNLNWQRLDSPRLFCNFSFLRFYQSWLFPPYYSLSLITRTFVKPVYWFLLACNILLCVEYFINGLPVIWNSSCKWVMFKVVSGVVPRFCSSAFGCQYMRNVLHPFLWYWCYKQTLWLLRKTFPLINVGGMILWIHHLKAINLWRQRWR